MNIVKALTRRSESEIPAGRIGNLRSLEEREEAEQQELARQLSEARLRFARSHSVWTEIPDDLVERHRGHFLVSASTDAYYTRVRGAVFNPGSPLAIADRSAYHFTVSAAGDLTFYERQHGTWTQYLELRAKRGR